MKKETKCVTCEQCNLHVKKDGRNYYYCDRKQQMIVKSKGRITDHMKTAPLWCPMKEGVKR